MGERRTIAALLSGQFLALGALALPDPSAPADLPRGRKAIGALLMAAGAALAGSGALALGGHLRPTPTPHPGSHVRTGGAYAISRHPIYLGLGLGALGRSLFSGGTRRWLATAGLAAVLHVKAGIEEDLLGEIQDYDHYAATVPRWGIGPRP